ncbi:MAG TPA: GTP cyclohydrolase II, partial [Anaerolineales bacterium]|nr:GTP cyclohydrolase II [Anaerolineales bacterium]
LDENRNHKCDGVGEDKVCVRIAAIGDLPTRFGDFQIVAFYNNRDNKEHAAIVRGNVLNAEDVPVRVHSECLTGDAIGSLRCDCRDQLETSLKRLGQMERGVLLYLRQEGRGIGLINKIRAYGLQDHGLDTVQANLALGFRDDERDYSVAAHMLFSLKIKSIQLMTNNPRKINELSKLGVNVTGRIPVIIPPNPFNEFYLKTKAEKSGHWLDPHHKLHLQEQSDMALVDGMSEAQVAELQQE